MRSAVQQFRPAPSAAAVTHFARRLSFETDCWDVHFALTEQEQDFVLLDVRSPDLYAKGHLPKALSLPHSEISRERLAEYPDETLFITYCSGPHCNGANRAALRIARLDRPVKMMIGGVTGWLDEGFELVGDGGA
ncbi:MAG: rhodanese-like domain-containing protein [Acidobacteriota bacterium]